MQAVIQVSLKSVLSTWVWQQHHFWRSLFMRKRAAQARALKRKPISASMARHCGWRAIDMSRNSIEAHRAASHTPVSWAASAVCSPAPGNIDDFAAEMSHKNDGEPLPIRRLKPCHPRKPSKSLQRLKGGNIHNARQA